jgi:hypothetical protein
MLDLVLPPSAAIHSPIREWLKDCTDSWLKNYLSDDVLGIGTPLGELTKGSPWMEATAVAMYVRLQEIPDGKSPHEAPALWARTLDANQASTLVDLAWAEFDAIVCLLDDLKSQTDLECSGWRTDIAWLFERRDDIESVRWVLAQSGRAEPLQRLFETMDRWIGLYLTSIPVPVTITDERLSRVASKGGLPATIGSIRFEAA